MQGCLFTYCICFKRLLDVAVCSPEVVPEKTRDLAALSANTTQALAKIVPRILHLHIPGTSSRANILLISNALALLYVQFRMLDILLPSLRQCPCFNVECRTRGSRVSAPCEDVIELQLPLHRERLKSAEIPRTGATKPYP
jgi:hypothetical protein